MLIVLFAAILAQLEAGYRPFKLKLPPREFLEALPDHVPHGCSYTLPNAEHALRHAMSLLVIVKGAVISPELNPRMLYSQHLVWLLDTLQTFSSIIVAWPTPLGVGLGPVLQTAMNLAEVHSSSRRLDAVLYHKASAVLVLVCTSFLQHPKPLLAEDEEGTSLRRVFCLALVRLSKASHDHEPTSRLVASGFLPLAQRMVFDNGLVGEGTDVWVCMNLPPVNSG